MCMSCNKSRGTAPAPKQFRSTGQKMISGGGGRRMSAGNAGSPYGTPKMKMSFTKRRT